jgi:mannosyltransferase
MPTPERKDRGDLLPVLALTLLALGLRLLGRGHESIWYDECFSLRMAEKGYVPLLIGAEGARDPGNPAGYFFLLRAWQDLWGSTTIETARALSAVAGALAVPAVWLLGRAAGASRATTLLACLLTAFAPGLVYLGQEARTFALVSAVATLTVACVCAIERHDKPLAWVGFALTGALLVHLHYYAFLVLFVLGLRLLVWGRGRWAPLLKLAASAVFVALAFAPFLPVFVWQLGFGTSRSAGTWWQQLALVPSFSVVGRTLLWKDDGARWVAALGVFIVVAVFLPLAWLLLRARNWPRPVAWFVVGLPLLVGLMGLAGKPMANAHYFSFLYPSLMLLIAWALVGGWQTSPRLMLGLAGVLALLMGASLARLYLGQHKTDWRGLTAVVAREGPDLPAYFYEDIGADPFAYYRPDQPRRRLVEPFGPDGEGWRRPGSIGLDEEPAEPTPRSYLDWMKAERKGFWVVLYTTNPTTVAEVGPICRLLGEEFVVEEDHSFGPLMRLLRCRPRRPHVGQAFQPGQVRRVRFADQRGSRSPVGPQSGPYMDPPVVALTGKQAE